ncbi:MAG: hypothetical protein HYV29_00200 [Ignavibacteriales bacterium]|nr:hypothetical protein [Ignavibacteriales bacterium]
MNDSTMEGIEVVDRLEVNGLVARLFGGAGIKHLNLLNKFNRERDIKDLDIVVKASDYQNIFNELTKLNWTPLPNQRSIDVSRKLTFFNRQNIMLDLYSDPLVFCHKLYLGERLILTSPHLNPSDLFLTKIQIVNLTQNDLEDLCALLFTYDYLTDQDERNCLNPKRIISVCQNEWGFYFTIKRSLSTIRDYCFNHDYTEIQQKIIFDRLDRIYYSITHMNKSWSWRIRDSIGTKIKWYNDVEN